jgi:hypothetical protein
VTVVGGEQGRRGEALYIMRENQSHILWRGRTPMSSSLWLAGSMTGKGRGRPLGNTYAGGLRFGGGLARGYVMLVAVVTACSQIPAGALALTNTSLLAPQDGESPDSLCCYKSTRSAAQTLRAA